MLTDEKTILDYMGSPRRESPIRRLLFNESRGVAVLVSAGSRSEPVAWNVDDTAGIIQQLAPVEVSIRVALQLWRTGRIVVRAEGDGWRYCTLAR